MRGKRNPYREGGPCFLAYEQGYMDAIEDVKKMLNGVNGNGDNETERAAGRAEQRGTDAGGLQHQ